MKIVCRAVQTGSLNKTVCASSLNGYEGRPVGGRIGEKVNAVSKTNSHAVATIIDFNVSDISDVNMKTPNRNYALTFDVQNNYCYSI